MVTNLKAWLTRLKPSSVKYTTPDNDELRSLAIQAHARKWKIADEALRKLKAVRIEAYNAEGELLDCCDFGEPNEPSDRGSPLSYAKDYSNLAAILDAQGKRIETAYAAGAEAASRGQENLVDVVAVLTQQWSAAMQSLHNVSMNLANVLLKTGGAEEADPNTQHLQQLLGVAAMKMMGGVMPIEPPPKNGKGK